MDTCSKHPVSILKFVRISVHAQQYADWDSISDDLIESFFVTCGIFNSTLMTPRILKIIKD